MIIFSEKKLRRIITEIVHNELRDYIKELALKQIDARMRWVGDAGAKAGAYKATQEFIKQELSGEKYIDSIVERINKKQVK